MLWLALALMGGIPSYGGDLTVDAHAPVSSYDYEDFKLIKYGHLQSRCSVGGRLKLRCEIAGDGRFEIWMRDEKRFQARLSQRESAQCQMPHFGPISCDIHRAQDVLHFQGL
ncbi:hypothetical protein [Woodsholea maritima]|uniref:hypothetical protein n=1 Tax=Woodsholea maritima TaxID=240237 RepID=UPI0003678A70|nr:hypothetical protein [Woodsholea maritima]